MPKELTPARRAWPLQCQGRASTLMKNGLLSKSISGFGRSKCRLGGSSPCSRASTVLIRLPTPAAVSVWPMLALSEPMAQ